MNCSITKTSLRNFLRLVPAAVAAAIFLSASPDLQAQENSYLAPGQPDFVALLAPPPAPGSAEETADLNSVRSVVKTRSPQDINTAKRDEDLSYQIFGDAIGPDFHVENLPKTLALLKKVKKTVAEPLDAAKEHWKRLRPYQLDKTISITKPEPSFGYPSGHSTHGTVNALVLAELFPEKRDAIMDIGRKLGWDRVILGKHYPTDIYAGRVFAQAIVREMMKNPQFVQDLAAAKAEIAASKH
jgi:acid phosphatase (class A)